MQQGRLRDRHSVIIRHDVWRRAIVVGLLIVAVGVIAASDTLHARASELVAWVEQAISATPVLGKAAFVLLAMVSAMVAFFSSALLTPVAIYAWGQGTCLALLWLGWFLGGIASFAIGRFFGRSVASAILGKEKIAHWESQLSARSRFVHILIFQAAVPSEIPGYVLGMLRYRFVLYLAALAITELPYAAATVYLGESFLKRDSTVFIALGIGFIVVATWLWLRAKPSAETRL